MDRISIWLLPILIILITPMSISSDEDVKQALVQFMDKLSPGSSQNNINWGWNMSSDPCSDRWAGVYCNYPENVSVGKIALDGYNLTGVFDAGSICMVNSLTILSLKQNQISGSIPEEIGQCKELTHLCLSGNKFSGSLPNSLSQLVNLKRLVISDNNFNGELPDLPRISGLVTFLAQNNHLSGKIPNFDFENFKKSEFNVANNNFSGPIPYLQGHLTADSFFGNSELCGEPLSTACPPSPAPLPSAEDSTPSYKGFFIYLGYIILGVVIVLSLALKFIPKNKPKKEKGDFEKNIIVDDKPSETSNEFRFGVNRSELSMTSFESAVTPSTLLVLTSPLAKELQFEDLLKAPAELLGRGKHGSLYKVVLNSGVALAVKKIKDWGISEEEFCSRLQKMDQVRHPNILPPVAFYCSKQEKLLVYEYQQKGSLFQLLHELQNGHKFDWGSRLSVAASIAEALAYMHKELHEDKIAHGNLKSTNILFDRNMNACISEYGLMEADKQEQPYLSRTSSFKNNNLSGVNTHDTFKLDVYAFGVILLELLTGKLVQNNGTELATWVHSVVREEWTVEVFNKALLSEGAREERMVNLLHVALNCINPSPNERPSMNHIAVTLNTLKQEEESSISFDTSGIYMGHQL